MKQIEITTSQYVTIRYKLGTVIDRILAFLLDIVIVSIAASVSFFLISYFNPFNDLNEVISYFVILPFLLFYHLFMEAFGGGRSFGKKALKLKPVKKNGAEMNFLDYFMRWIFRIPDILFSLGTLAVIMISSSSVAQRLGDLLADTVVIKTEDSQKFGLNWMLKMNKKQESYKPIYPQVSQLSEKDILLIKEVAERYIKYKNQASGEALDSMIKKIEEHLNINAPDNKLEFLKDLVTDYVFLTR